MIGILRRFLPRWHHPPPERQLQTPPEEFDTFSKRVKRLEIQERLLESRNRKGRGGDYG